MVRKFRMLIVAVLAAFTASISPAAAQVAEDGVHRLVLYISEPSMEKMNSVLDVAANVSRHYSDIGEEVEIEVVAFNRGLHMVRADTSPVKKRLTNFMQSMVNVTFQACGNTIDSMARSEGEKPPLIEGTGIVQTGVARLLELDEQGWTIVQP